MLEKRFFDGDGDGDGKKPSPSNAITAGHTNNQRDDDGIKPSPSPPKSIPNVDGGDGSKVAGKVSGGGNGVTDALLKLYSLLNERDVLCGVWRHMSVCHVTNVAIALEQFGLWPRAQETFFLAMANAHRVKDCTSNMLPQVCVRGWGWRWG